MAVDLSKTVADGFLEQGFVLDQNYMIVDILDVFQSFYWRERYNSTGDFEIVLPILEAHLPYLRIGNYLAIKESETYMIIEDVTLNTEVEQGDTLTVSGRTLESMLDRRVIWNPIKIRDTVQSLIMLIINQNAAHPTNSKRQLPLEIKASTDPLVTSPAEDAEYFGENVLEEVNRLCQAHNIGFKAIPVGGGRFEVELYAGKDRSWLQNEVPPVVFSNSYENLLESNYIQTEVEYASNALVKGDENDITMEVLRRNERTGLARREIFIDTGLQPEEQEYQDYVLDESGNKIIEEVIKTDGNGKEIIDPATGQPMKIKRYKTETKTRKIYDQSYYNRMLAEAKIEMAQHKVTEAFDSAVDITKQFFYGVDYFLGDIVQVENRYGFNGRCRITEIMRSRDANGPKLVPSFVMVDDNGNEVA